MDLFKKIIYIFSDHPGIFDCIALNVCSQQGAFPSFMVSMIQAGESSGSLDVIIRRALTRVRPDVSIALS